MAYDKNQLEKMALDAITTHGLIFIEEVVSFLPCCKETFYNHNLHESDAIKAELNRFRIMEKKGMRSEWRANPNPTLQISLYKLLASEEELRRLSVTKNEHSGNNGKPIEVQSTINLQNLSLDELEKLEQIVAKLEGNQDREGEEEL